jgi:hypothetical protein
LLELIVAPALNPKRLLYPTAPLIVVIAAPALVPAIILF